MDLTIGVAKLKQLGLKSGPTRPIDSGGQVRISKVQVVEFGQAHDVFEFSD